MVQSLDYLRETASQTAGPYVHIGLAPGAAGFDIYAQELGQDIAGDAPGARIRVEGLVFDGTGAPVKDVLIEVWQADANGIYPHPDDPRHAEAAPGFRGYGRVITDFDTGLWSFETIRPGPVPGRSGTTQAPHISFWIVARGINIGLQTRMYFGDTDTRADPVLTMIEQVHRRATLIAARSDTGGDTGATPTYRFDIHLQGDAETVFFDF